MSDTYPKQWRILGTKVQRKEHAELLQQSPGFTRVTETMACLFQAGCFCVTLVQVEPECHH